MPEVNSNGRFSLELHTKMKIVCAMMLKVHYYEEANWLWMAVGSPRLCVSPVALNALRSAAVVSRQFGFPDVATWINNTMAGGQASVLPPEHRAETAPPRSDGTHAHV